MNKVMDVLKELPEIFNASYMHNQLGYNAETVKTTLSRWSKKGWIEPLGGRSEVYLNSIKHQGHPWREKGLVEADPSATLTGATVFRIYGWTTQIAQRPTVTLSVRKLQSTEHFNIQQRSTSWYYKILKGVISNKADIPVLHPSWCLVDAIYRMEDSWLPPPDDLEWDTIESIDSREQLRLALETLGPFYYQSNHKQIIDVPSEDETIESWYENIYSSVKYGNSYSSMNF